MQDTAQVTICSMGGQTWHRALRPDDSVRRLKEDVATEAHAPALALHLALGTQVLLDESPLGRSGVRNGAHLALVCDARGMRIADALNRAGDNLRLAANELAGMPPENMEELMFFVSFILRKAFGESERVEQYVDMVLLLQEFWPAVPSPEKPTTLLRELLNSCQDEFEQLRSMTREQALGCVLLISTLFVRKHMGVKVLHQVVHDLIVFHRAEPEGGYADCLCAMLRTCGTAIKARDTERVVAGELALCLISASDESTSDVAETSNLSWLKPEVQVTLLELFGGSMPCKEASTRPMSMRAFRLGDLASA